jgi:hypothetical protein
MGADADRLRRTAGSREEHACPHHAAYLVVGALGAEQLTLGHDVIVDPVNGPEQARGKAVGPVTPAATQSATWTWIPVVSPPC